MKNSAIQWTHHTYNPWLGCRKVCDECDLCYIVNQTPLRVRNIVHGSERHRCADSTLKQPFAWNRAAKKAGERHRVFCLSLGDWADSEVPDEWRNDLFQVIRMTPDLDWLLLTKRPKLAARYLKEAPQNVWLGVSAGVDTSPIFDIPATVHFLSCEPMLRPLNESQAARFDWIIFGGESDPGGKARPCNVSWIRDGVTFCRENGIPVFVKQLGAKPYDNDVYRVGAPHFEGWTLVHSDAVGPHWYKYFRLKDSHGGDWNEWPQEFRIREFPNASPVHEVHKTPTLSREKRKPN